MANETVYYHETLSGQVFSGTDRLEVLSGGTSSSNLFEGSATDSVDGKSVGDTASGGGQTGSAFRSQPIIYANGSVLDAHVFDGATLYVSPGAVTSGATLSGVATDPTGSYGPAAASEQVQSGGVALGTSVQSGAQLQVNGLAVGGAVYSGGSAMVNGYGFPTAAVSSMTIYAGGTISVGGGSATALVISGGEVDVDGIGGFISGHAIGTTVLSGGVLAIGYAVDTNTVIAIGGLEELTPEASSTGVIIAGGTLELLSGAIPGSYPLSSGIGRETGPITFAGSGGTLLVRGANAPGSVISGFDATDHIILAGVPADPHATLRVAGDVVTVSAAGHAYAIDVAGAAMIPFTLGIGTTAGTVDIGVACYCAGTEILTTTGEVPVERITAGHRVITADGRAERVVWVGRRSYAGRFLARQQQLLPIRIMAGALGGGLPRRDLLVSPCHAMKLDGLLVAAGLLTNGRTIVQERGASRVDYIHIELERHDVILAEGAPSETYLDDDNRNLFANAPSFTGEGAVGAYCAPRVSEGYALEAIRARLAVLSPAIAQAG